MDAAVEVADWTLNVVDDTVFDTVDFLTGGAIDVDYDDGQFSAGVDLKALGPVLVVLFQELLVGATLDFVELQPGEFQFVFINPNDPPPIMGGCGGGSGGGCGSCGSGSGGGCA